MGVESIPWKTPEVSGMEKALWAITHALRILVKEVAARWKLERRMEKLMQDLIDQVKSGADSLELFARGTGTCRCGRWENQKGWK